MNKLFQSIAAIAITLCFSSGVYAHYIWIETPDILQAGSEHIIKIYYGEYNEGLREIKDGRLEEVNGIVCWIITPDGKKLDLEVHIEQKFFQAKFTSAIQGTYTIVAMNNVREVMDWSAYDIGIVRPVYYTSKQIIVGNNQSTYPFDNRLYPEFVIVPHSTTEISEPAFQLLRNNRPLSNTKLLVHAPNEWSKEFKTNEEGVFTIHPHWKGQYVVECIYPEKNPGTFKETDYEAIWHRVTYTYLVADQ